MSRSVDRHPHISLVLCALFVLSSPAAETHRAQASADARLRALYTEEWKWRQQEVARSDQYAAAGTSDRFPRVDPASQQARLAYWTQTLAALDAIPFDQLSAEEKVNAQRLPRVHSRARQRRDSSGLTKRRSTATPSSGLSSRRARASPRSTPTAPIWGVSATCRATSTSRSPTCGPASRAASPCRACRSSAATRRSSRT